jgi:hypothetical protein
VSLVGVPSGRVRRAVTAGTPTAARLLNGARR